MRGVIYFGSLDNLTRWERSNGPLGSTKLGFCSKCQVGAGVPETEVSQEAGLGRGTLGMEDTHPKSGEPMMDRVPLDATWACPPCQFRLALRAQASEVSKRLALPSLAAAGSPEGGSLSFLHPATQACGQLGTSDVYFVLSQVQKELTALHTKPALISCFAPSWPVKAAKTRD